MLAAGRDILESHGLKTDIFMAPAHSYDNNTLRALRELGYAKITDGFGKRPYRRAGLTFYPISFRLDKSLKKAGGVTTLVVHTNTMTDPELEKYRRIFESGKVISYSEYLKIPAVRRGMAGRLAEYGMACLKHLLVKLL